jgi:flagellar assembly factor FliW
MSVNFRQLDKKNKQIQFTDGVYSFEENRESRWIWTSSNFSGIAKNIEYVTLTIISEMDNVLIYDGESMNIKPKYINIVRLKVNEESKFTVKLENPYIVDGDNRELGVKIIGISADDILIF